jgi:hypothetical protein
MISMTPSAAELQDRPEGPCRFSDHHSGEPSARVDLRFSGKPDHVDARRPAGSAFERNVPAGVPGLAAHGMQRRAGAGLAAAAHHLEPAMTSVKAKCDRRSCSHRTAELLYLRRPQQAFGSVHLANCLFGTFAGMQTDPGAPDMVAKNANSADASHAPFHRPSRLFAIP